jgi:multimeric flavodoxin WrbA
MEKQVLIIYYSYSGQTRKLIHAFAEGLEQGGAAVNRLALKPEKKLQFPFGSMFTTFVMMVQTFFRKRVPIAKLQPETGINCDLIIVAGPTWSYNLSGPLLSFFDGYGEMLSNKKVLPFISCRGYWRLHFLQLRHILSKRKAKALQPVIFLHTGPEPWRTIGVFLKIAGYSPESDSSWMRRYYPRFGHSREQIEYARQMGLAFWQKFTNDGNGFEKPLVVREIEGEQSRCR